MYHIQLRNFIFTIVVFNTASVTAITKSPCPLACKCDLERGVVDCPYGGWNKLPKIPVGTKEVRIKGGEFGKLQGPSSCQSYSNVTHLELVDNRITSMDENALGCMPKLQTLTVHKNPVHNIPNKTFECVPNLLNIAISRNNLPVNRMAMLCNIKRIEMLDLSFNYKRYRPGNLNCLGYLEHLSHVDLSGNFLGYKFKQTIQPLQNVSISISIAVSNIESFPDDTFSGFRVTVLDLSFNEIKYIQSNTFTHLPNLIKLKLAGNPLAEIREWLMNLNSLKEIDLRFKTTDTIPVLYDDRDYRKIIDFQCDIFFFSGYKSQGKFNVVKNTFLNLKMLETLYLGCNVIAQTDITILLSDISHCPLKVLSLSGIPMFSLNNTFEAFSQNKLTKLYLQRCKIVSILPRTFEHFQYLQELDLSHNEIKNLSEKIFQSLVNLTTLNLHHNHIAIFNGEFFGLGNSLRTLDVSNNWILIMSLRPISTLMKIAFSHNRLQHMSKLENLWSWRQLRRSFNDLLYEYPFLNDLSDLDLSDNHLPSWKHFSRFPGLKRLNLSKTSFGLQHRKEQKQIWSNSSQLTNLDISHCKIKSLAPGLFSMLGNLQVLNLSSNQIPSIHQSAFQGASSLTELYLQGNNIRYVNFESFVFTPHLRLLSLANNPLLCTCNVLWISQAVTTHDLVFIHNQDETVCSSPTSVENVKIKELNLTLSDCEIQWSLLILKTLGGGTASVLVLVFLYIVWYYRWHLRYTLFLARAGRGRFKEMCDDHEYLYDAFVAYSIEDLPWVKQQLLPNIDVDYFGPRGFKLCLHHRDWLVGVDIAENIVKSIAESRRTILVLSKDFAASYWCRFELAMAHMKLDVEGGNKSRLMVILLNYIPPKLLNPRLVHILGTKTYIAWPQDPNEHQLFWKTLRKSLRKELLYTTKV